MSLPLAVAYLTGWAALSPDLDLKLLLTAGFPPVLAILAEKFNPVSEERIRDRAEKSVAPFVVASTPDRDRAVSGLADVVRDTASGALEAGGVLPTWISCTAAVVATAADKGNPLHIAVGALLWTAVSGCFGIWLVSKVDVYELAITVSPGALLRIIARTRLKAISSLLVLVNAIVLTFVWHCATPPPAVAPKAPHAAAAAAHPTFPATPNDARPAHPSKKSVTYSP